MDITDVIFPHNGLFGQHLTEEWLRRAQSNGFEVTFVDWHTHLNAPVFIFQNKAYVLVADGNYIGARRVRPGEVYPASVTTQFVPKRASQYHKKECVHAWLLAAQMARIGLTLLASDQLIGSTTMKEASFCGQAFCHEDRYTYEIHAVQSNDGQLRVGAIFLSS